MNPTLYKNVKKHERLGVDYLLKNGYKIEDININSGVSSPGTPDIITTNDNQYWEVKVINPGSVVQFTGAQLFMDKDTNILIFKKNGKFIESIKFCEMLNNDLKYRSRFSFNLNANDALHIHRNLGMYKCDYDNMLPRFGMSYKVSKMFESTFSSVNTSVSTDTYVLPEKDNQNEDQSNGTFFKLDILFGRFEYYINDEIVGDIYKPFVSNNITIRMAGSIYTKKLIDCLKTISNTPYHKYGDKRSELSFDIGGFKKSMHRLFNPIVFINDTPVADLSDGDNLTIKAIGGSEIETIVKCSEFASAQLEYQRVVNTFRYIISECNDINNQCITQLNNIETEFMDKLKNMYRNTSYKLADIYINEVENDIFRRMDNI